MKRIAPEESFLRAVIDLAHMHGWRVAHFRTARTKSGWRTAVGADGVGWPDLFMCRSDEALVRELKVPPNDLTPEQKEWLETLNAAGVDARVWTPDDWPEIEATLRTQ